MADAVSQKATQRRKDAHLDLCADGEVEPEGNRTLFEDVRLLHCAMPELELSEIDLRASLFGRPLQAPLLITGMTGGTERAGAVNRDLAQVAERAGVAFGVGSQRAMAEDPSVARSFQIRDVAPNVVLVGNIGLQQARLMGESTVRKLVDDLGADGLALHLNAGQELTQPEGDRDFREGYRTVEWVVKALSGRVLVKETGCGISAPVAKRLVEAGVRTLDVSGLGGTSWVRMEQLRADGQAFELGKQFSSWGIPTAAALASVRGAVPAQVSLIASGGMRDGLQSAKALALGADLVGMALPLFRAHQEGGLVGAERALGTVLAGLRQAMLLTGSRDVAALRQAGRVVLGELKDWLAALLHNERST